MGLKSDGTVVAVGKNDYGQLNVELVEQTSCRWPQVRFTPWA